MMATGRKARNTSLKNFGRCTECSVQPNIIVSWDHKSRVPLRCNIELEKTHRASEIVQRSQPSHKNGHRPYNPVHHWVHLTTDSSMNQRPVLSLVSIVGVSIQMAF